MIIARPNWNSLFVIGGMILLILMPLRYFILVYCPFETRNIL